MTSRKTNHVPIRCEVCKRRVSHGDAMPLDLVHGPVADLIQKKHPDLPSAGFICFKDLNRFRNYVVHQYRRHKPLAVPTAEAVEQITAIRNELLSPPSLVALAAKPVEQCCPTDPLGCSVKKMHDGVFSQLPVYDGQKCLGLLTAETIARWLANHLGDGAGLVEEKPIADVMKHQEDHDNHTFLARTATVADGLAAFDDFLCRGKRLEAILITQNGRPAEALLGIVTIHDIPKLNQAIHR